MTDRIAPVKDLGAAERHRTLLAINNALISNLTREALLHAVARALGRVLTFDRVAIFLPDPGERSLTLSFLEGSLPSDHFAVGWKTGPGDSPVAWAFERQQPVLRRDLAAEAEYPAERRAVADGVRSLMVVPLVARGTSVGTLSVSSAAPRRYGERELEFLQEVGSQIALAVENMKAYEEISALNARASEAAERHRTLLEINNAIISNLTRDALFRAVARALRQVLPFDRTAAFLHDPAREVLKLFVLESSLPSAYFVVGLEMPLEGSHVGWVFRNRRHLLRRDLERERQYPMEERAFADGVRSYVIVPLVARGRGVGTLAVASTRVNQYSEADAAFLEEAASQIALAVENMKAYEEIAALNASLLEEAGRREAAEATVRSIMEGTASVTGTDFFRSLVRHLAAALQVRYAFVAECRGTARARTLAFWRGDDFAADFEYDVAQTPCQKVVEGEVGHCPTGVQGLFPHDRDLVDLGAESYLGVPMIDLSEQVVGHLAILDDRPMPADPWKVQVLTVFAARGAAELKRQQAEEDLRGALTELDRLRRRLEHENVYLQEEIRREHNFVEVVGGSPALLAVLRQVEQVAPADSTVLITGETGTGKELVARALHDRSARKDRPLVKVNCSALSAGLVESELFGHVKGAFTGALDRRMGRFELADGGTIFLDEVGELPLETQVKLLRVLQEQEFEPVGSSRSVRVDVRVIAATNRDLEEAVRAGRFRPDLFYRLNVFPIAVPPLRERRTDIPQLVMFFLSRLAKKFSKKIEAASQETMDRLMSYPWPGNIRELQNIIERAVVLAQGPVLELGPDLLPAATPGDRPGAFAEVAAGVSRPAEKFPAGRPPTSPGGEPLSTLEEVERGHILAALRQTGGVVEGPKGAARILKIHPNTLRSRMEKLGIKRSRHDIS